MPSKDAIGLGYLVKATAGLVCPSQKVLVETSGGESIRVGVPDELQSTVVRLMNLWNRPDPSLHKAPGRAPEGGRGGAGGGAARGRGGRAGRGDASRGKGRTGVPQSDRQLRTKGAGGERRVLFPGQGMPLAGGAAKKWFSNQS